MSDTPATGPATGAAITVRAPAKINLHLAVGPVRPDGFHPLITVYQAVGLYDDVSVREAEEWAVEVVPAGGGPAVAGVPTGADNLAVRAGRALTSYAGSGGAANITITKGIPVAGGMAGGSADAAATLVALDRLWDLGTPDETMLEIAAGLGSDVPFALLGGTAVGSGRGEVVQPVEDHGTWWWVVVPHRAGLATPAVYAEYDRLGLAEPPQPALSLLAALEYGDLTDLADTVGNDLQPAALSLAPELADTLGALTEAGAYASLLSGSGPTCLGLAGDAEHARAMAGRLSEQGYDAVLCAPGPVAGAHLVSYA